MSKKQNSKKGRSGNPKKAAEQAAAAAVVKNPCIRCKANSRNRGGLWCEPCVVKAKRNARKGGGGMFGGKASPAQKLASAKGIAAQLGMLDAEGNLLPEEDAA
jgi:hypothetical protein